MPGFTADADPASGGYVVYVAALVTDVTVRAGATHTGAMVAITADTDADGDTDTDSPEPISLATGSDNDTKIDVKVTAQDGFTSETYTINVMKVEDASITAMLSSLSVMAGGKNLTLTPSFMPDGAPAQDGYMADVSAATSSVVVNAVTSHTGATVKTSSGTQTGDGVNDRFRLKAAGMATEIKVEVTAQDKATTLAYMITVTRASSTASTNTNLRTLMLTMDDGDDPVNLTPSFVANRGPASGGYSASVGSANTVTLNASSSHAGSVISVMAKGAGITSEELNADEDGEYSGDITLATSGATDIEVKVTAEDGVAEAKYMITVSKDVASSSSTLSSLILDGIDLIPAFDSGTRAYIATASADTATAEVMVTTAHSKADVVIRKVVGDDDTAAGATEFDDDDMEYGKGFGSVSAMVPLSIGINTITIQVNAVSAPDTDDAMIYRVRVRRAESGQRDSQRAEPWR